jgi:glycerophosphoryl diester phosphodiesterase
MNKVSSTRKRLYGHRGARGRAPENTVVAFAAALEDGANALELDVRLTKDGVVVVFHDDDGQRMAGIPRRVDEVTFDEMRRWDLGYGFVASPGGLPPVPSMLGGDPRRPFAGRGLSVPTFVDVLRTFPGISVNVDLKTRDPALVAKVVAIVEQEKATARVLLTSFLDDVIEAVQATGTTAATGLGPASVRLLRFLPLSICRRLLRRHVVRGGSRVQIPPRVSLVRLDQENFIARCHDLGFAVDYWVIDDAAQAADLLGRGADGCMSDHPRRLAALFPT